MANFSKKYYFYEFYYDRFYYLCTRKMKRAPAFIADKHFLLRTRPCTRKMKRVWMFCMHLCIWKSNFCIKPK